MNFRPLILKRYIVVWVLRVTSLLGHVRLLNESYRPTRSARPVSKHTARQPPPRRLSRHARTEHIGDARAEDWHKLCLWCLESLSTCTYEGFGRSIALSGGAAVVVGMGLADTSKRLLVCPSRLELAVAGAGDVLRVTRAMSWRNTRGRDLPNHNSALAGGWRVR